MEHPTTTDIVFRFNRNEQAYIYRWATRAPRQSTQGQIARFLLWVDQNIPNYLPIQEAAKLLGFTMRRVRALYKKWNEQGVVSVIHGKSHIYFRKTLLKDR